MPEAKSVAQNTESNKFSIEIAQLKKLKEIAFEWRATFYILSKNDQNSISFYQDVWKQLLHS